MNQVKVRKTELIEKLKANREKHRALFLEAQDNFRREVTNALENRLRAAREGRPVDLYIRLPEPEDHTGDYDDAIAMLDMSVDDELEITRQDFSRYVMDNWEWRASFLSNTVRYTSEAR